MPELREEQAIIKIEMCDIRGSDVTAYRGVNPTMRYPTDGLGYEGVGVIQEIRENDKGLKPGDRVTLEPYVPCNKCHICAAGYFNNYVGLHMCGVHKDGMMPEYFFRPIQLLYKLPDKLTSTHTALVEPLTVGLHGATKARVLKGEYCAVFGADIIGLMATFACINYSTTPTLVDVLQKRLDYVKELGVPCASSPGDGSVEEYLREVTSGELPEAMIDYTGAPVILENMYNYVYHGGRTALVGWPRDPVRTNTARLIRKGTDVCPFRNSNGKFLEAISLVNEDRVPTDAIVAKMIELGQMEGTIKDIIQFPSDYLKVIASI